MLRHLLLAGTFVLSLSLGSCQRHCTKMSKTNQKLIAGNHDFGKKTKKWKKKQKY